MKRSLAIQKLIHKVIHPTEVIEKRFYDSGLYEARAAALLDFIEKELGMKPPQVDFDKLQAMYHVYIEPNGNIWDEDFEKDSKLVEAYNKRISRNKNES